MAKALDLAKENLLESSGLDENSIGGVLSSLMAPGVDDAELYFQHSRSESWSLEDGIVKEAGFGVARGVGVRAVSGEKTGFAYSDEIVLPALMDAGAAARAIVQSGGDGQLQAWRQSGRRDLYPQDNPAASMGAPEKVALLRSMDEAARRADTRVKQVMVSLSGTHDIVLVAAADGTLTADVRPLVRLNAIVVAEDGGLKERGVSGAGGRYDYNTLLERHDPRELVEEAVRYALLNLEAVPAPAGEMVVVLGPGWPGVLLHEAIGHGLEGDFCRKGTSAFSDRIGERVAAAEVTVVDDGTLPDRRGSLNMDDEGVPTQCTTLIENGVLKGYMQDKLNARLMGAAPTGNGRRQSYAHLPMPRMTNTYMLPGRHDPEEIIRSVDRGIYAANFGGGQVDITSGKFVFSACEAYRIEAGKIAAPVKGVSLVGNGPDVLTRVSLVGNDLKLDDGIGSCGKHGQMVPVGVGQPTMRVDGLTVGGTGS